MPVKASRTRWYHDDRGSGPVDLAVVMVPILVLVFTTVVIGMLYYAHIVALAAAQQGADAARAYQATQDAGHDHAEAFVDRAVGDRFGTPTIEVTEDAATVSITVRLYPVRLPILPDRWFSVAQTASGPRERLTAPGAP